MIIIQRNIVIITPTLTPNPNPVNNNSPIQDNVHPDDQTQPTFETTRGFKPFTVILMFFLLSLGIAESVGFFLRSWGQFIAASKNFKTLKTIKS